MSNLVGQQVSHYQIKALLGSGRIGTVYQAIDLKDFSVVALKIIKLEFARQHDVRRRFLEEIKSRPHLDHPGIIQVYEAGIDTRLDLLYMTMAFMTGRSLTAYLQQLEFNKQRINMHTALILIAEVAEALHYAHEKGLVHQDVRPNVILFKTEGKSDRSGLLPGQAAIGDFTLTTILEQEAELFADSLPYLAPELFLAQGSDGRSDIYSLGIILYQLMTGRTPFSAGTVAEATRQHPYQDPPLPSSIRTDLPIAIEDAILKAIAKKPENRYQTGAEMAHALRQLADAISTKASISDKQPDISIVKTQPEPLDSLAIHSAWSTNEDRVTITRNLPHSLNRQVITVGRSESNDIVLPETSITRRHAQLERTQTGWQVRDLGSQNGTYLDGKALLPDIPEDWDS
ncbi:MAG: protein kinase, partial [Anaerolineales bacterium]|nr:protein kinase [Anaerolineales bacterium]